MFGFARKDYNGLSKFREVDDELAMSTLNTIGFSLDVLLKFHIGDFCDQLIVP
jgi:hypothetical protein